MIIPQTIPECFTFLRVLVDTPTLIRLQNTRRRKLVDFQHDLGMFIRNNWLYSEKSPLVKTLKFLGMKKLNEVVLSALIIEVFWEDLNGQEYNEAEFVERLLKLSTMY